MPLATAGGLDYCAAGGEVSRAGPGDVILGPLEIPPLVSVVVVELLFGAAPVSGQIVTALELPPQEFFRKTTVPEV